MNAIRVFKLNYFIISLALLLLLVSVEASATTYYVHDATGNDTTGDGSEGSPFKTIQKGANTATSAGDTVIVRDGTYIDDNADGYVVLTKAAGTSANWITFKSENKWGAVIDGQSNTTFYGFFINSNDDYIRIEGFEIKDIVKAVFDNYRTTGLYVKDCYIHDTGRVYYNGLDGREAIYVGVDCADMTFDSNIFHTIGRLNPSDGEDASVCTTPDPYWYYGTNYPNLNACWNHDHALYIQGGASNITIINNIFYDIEAGWSVNVKGGTSNVKIINNSFNGQNPGRTGNHIIVYGNCSPVGIRNNIFNDPKTAPMKIKDNNTGEITNNLIYPDVPMFDPAAGYDDFDGGGMTISDNILNEDPLFTDINNNDYTLQSSSPAIDAGIVDNAPSLDHDGNTRPQGSSYDIGAYEYVSSGPPDTQAPSIPANLNATPISTSQIDLTWTASTDNVGVTGYKIYRDNVQIDTSIITSYSDTSLTENTTYSYIVSAYDAAGNESGQSGSSQATTIGDTTPPTITSASANSSTQITVVFSEPIEESSATNMLNYSIDNAITVFTASLGSDLKTVTLTTSELTDGATYILTVNNIIDLASNPNVIAPNTTASYTFVNQLVISNLTVESGQAYEIVEKGLQNGAMVYIDRESIYSSVPTLLKGATYIKTANKDKGKSKSSFLTFDVNQDVTVYVAHDDQITKKPSWLTSFTDTGNDLVTTDTALSIFANNFLAGTITLGGNEGKGNRSMYTVIIVKYDDSGGSGCTDADGDGWCVEDGDCDDNNPNTYPSATEFCDGIDNNCDGVIDEGCGGGCTDNDGDGWCIEDGDCDDNDRHVNPGHNDAGGRWGKDGVDNDCNGIIDG